MHAAIYMFTAKPIAEAVADAKKRGVDVQIIIDKVSYESVFGKGKMLKDSGINIWVYQAKDKAHYPSKNTHGGFMPLMHNKFAILDEKVWTGSFNWTHAANSNNCENVIVTDDPVVCKRYLNHFQDLKQKCKQANVARPSRGYYDSIKEAIRQLLETVNKRK
jgi:phosphatidylserine/phosphatidylglycerophosphate/cardiolipin synthase-like enzyme